MSDRIALANPYDRGRTHPLVVAHRVRARSATVQRALALGVMTAGLGAAGAGAASAADLDFADSADTADSAVLPDGLDADPAQSPAASIFPDLPYLPYLAGLRDLPGTPASLPDLRDLAPLLEVPATPTLTGRPDAAEPDLRPEPSTAAKAPDLTPDEAIPPGEVDVELTTPGTGTTPGGTDRPTLPTTTGDPVPLRPAQTTRTTTSATTTTTQPSDPGEHTTPAATAVLATAPAPGPIQQFLGGVGDGVRDRFRVPEPTRRMIEHFASGRWGEGVDTAVQAQHAQHAAEQQQRREQQEHTARLVRGSWAEFRSLLPGPQRESARREAAEVRNEIHRVRQATPQTTRRTAADTAGHAVGDAAVEILTEVPELLWSRPRPARPTTLARNHTTRTPDTVDATATATSSARPPADTQDTTTQLDQPTNPELDVTTPIAPALHPTTPTTRTTPPAPTGSDVDEQPPTPVLALPPHDPAATSRKLHRVQEAQIAALVDQEVARRRADAHRRRYESAQAAYESAPADARLRATLAGDLQRAYWQLRRTRFDVARIDIEFDDLDRLREAVVALDTAERLAVDSTASAGDEGALHHAGTDTHGSTPAERYVAAAERAVVAAEQQQRINARIAQVSAPESAFDADAPSRLPADIALSGDDPFADVREHLDDLHRIAGTNQEEALEHLKSTAEAFAVDRWLRFLDAPAPVRPDDAPATIKAVRKMRAQVRQVVTQLHADQRELQYDPQGFDYESRDDTWDYLFHLQQVSRTYLDRAPIRAPSPPAVARSFRPVGHSIGSGTVVARQRLPTVDHSVVRDLAVPDESYLLHPDLFRQHHQDAIDRYRSGGAVVPLLSGPITPTDRTIGFELEFDLDSPLPNDPRLIAIGQELHSAGLTDAPQQLQYHSRRGVYPSTHSGGWTFELDQSVAGEVTSPILGGRPEDTSRLAEVLDILTRHDARASKRTGMHVHVGVGDYGTDVAPHNALLRTMGTFQDHWYRLAGRPPHHPHRGVRFCTPTDVDPCAYSRPFLPKRPAVVNFEHVEGGVDDHVEFRLWDGSLDAGVVQAQARLSAAATDLAFRAPGLRYPRAAAQPLGHRRGTSVVLDPTRGGDLTHVLPRQAWLDETQGIRLLLDLLYPTDIAGKQQATALWAQTRWQEASPR